MRLCFYLIPCASWSTLFLVYKTSKKMKSIEAIKRYVAQSACILLEFLHIGEHWRTLDDFGCGKVYNTDGIHMGSGFKHPPWAPSPRTSSSPWHASSAVPLSTCQVICLFCHAQHAAPARTAALDQCRDVRGTLK